MFEYEIRNGVSADSYLIIKGFGNELRSYIQSDFLHGPRITFYRKRRAVTTRRFLKNRSTKKVAVCCSVNEESALQIALNQ